MNATKPELSKAQAYLYKQTLAWIMMGFALIALLLMMGFLISGAVVSDRPRMLFEVGFLLSSLLVVVALSASAAARSDGWNRVIWRTVDRSGDWDLITPDGGQSE